MKSMKREKCTFSPTTLWLTGLSGAGKTTLAIKLNEELTQLGYKTRMLDGDNLRDGLNSDLGFSKEDRSENIRRFSEVAKLFRETGILNIISVISPFISDRQKARSLTASDEQFIEIFVDCPIEECQKRDPKGLYHKAISGEIPEFTGISSPYERPKNPDIHIRTDLLTVDQSIDRIITVLQQRAIL